MRVVFDLDGTLADITHRVPLIQGQHKDYDAFFAACVDDLPHQHVIDTLRAHIASGHHVEIWSARSDAVKEATHGWLSANGIDPAILAHMRADGDYTEDAALKRSWLHALHPDDRPSIVYDDRQRVVDMWRAEGIACFQVVADWEKDERTIAPIMDPILTVMVGPSGGGKSTWVRENTMPEWIVETDGLRAIYCNGNIADQSRNDDVFYAAHRLTKARLECGLPVVFDATNLYRKDRMAVAALAGGNPVHYVVCNRPMKQKLDDAGWRPPHVIEKHEQRFNSQLKDILAGDNLPNVTVLDTRE